MSDTCKYRSNNWHTATLKERKLQEITVYSLFTTVQTPSACFIWYVETVKYNSYGLNCD